jgi:hypothetical protein
MASGATRRRVLPALPTGIWTWARRTAVAAIGAALCAVAVRTSAAPDRPPPNPGGGADVTAEAPATKPTKPANADAVRRDDLAKADEQVRDARDQARRAEADAARARDEAVAARVEADRQRLADAAERRRAEAERDHAEKRLAETKQAEEAAGAALEEAAARSRISAAERALVGALHGADKPLQPPGAPAAPVPPGGDVGPTTVPAASAKAMARLQDRADEVKLDGAGLSDAIDFFRDRTGLSVYVNWKVVEAFGIDRKAPVTLRLKDAKYADVLRLMLNDAGGQASLDYTVDDGTVVVTTADDLVRHTTVRVYDVSDLIAPTPDQDPAAGSDKLEKLTQLIQETVAPGSWRDVGGSIGSLRTFNGKLVVNHTETRQQDIDRLLGALRELRELGDAADNAPADPAAPPAGPPAGAQSGPQSAPSPNPVPPRPADIGPATVRPPPVQPPTIPPEQGTGRP